MAKLFTSVVFLVGCAVLPVGTAIAQSIQLRPLNDMRVRYEHVEQDGTQRAADALTVRIRTGVEAKLGAVSALVEGQGNLAIVNRYDDNVSGPSRYAAVGDPQDIALYRAQLAYTAKDLTLTAGRQRIALDDERFVGASNWRQNGRTYDAVRAEYILLPGLHADAIYAWSVRTPSGINGSGAKPQAIGGGNVFARLAWHAPLGTVSGFAYLIDQDEANVQGFRLSNQSYGARWTGDGRVAAGVKASWALSYATQSAYHRNPNAYRASYYLADVNLDLHSAKLEAGYEVLGASKGVSLTSFQTPLSSAFRFQGWADKFTTTPPNGVKDLYGSVSWTWKAVGPFKSVLVQAMYHRFDSDRLALHYGNETDVLASTKWHHAVISARYASYQADRFATDTRKFWLQLDVSI